MKKESQIQSINTLSKTVLSLMDLEPIPLEESTREATNSQCMARISSFESPYSENWKEIQKIVYSNMDNVVHQTQYVSLAGEHERAELLARHPELQSVINLQIRYHVGGQISIRSIVKIRSENEHVWDTINEFDFVCVHDHTTLESDGIRARREEAIDRVKSLTK